MQINIDQVKGLEDKLKELEARIEAIEKAAPRKDKETDEIIITTQETKTE